MALFTPSESPAVVVKEIDLTGGVPNVQSTTGAVVGNFRWGPVEKVTSVSSEAELVDIFANPDSFNTQDFHNASYFLRYSTSLNVVRNITTDAKNAKSGNVGNAITIKNKQDFDGQQATLADSSYGFAGRFPGALGNSLQVSLCPAADSSAAIFDGWAYASSFDGFPSTSSYANARLSNALDEVHVAVVDEDGLFTGTKGTVLETFPYLSQASNAKSPEGSSIYLKDVINEKSEYVHMITMPSTFTRFGRVVDASADSFTSSGSITSLSLDSGVNSGAFGTTQYTEGFDQFNDKDIVEIDFLISPSMATSTNQKTVVNDLVSIAEARKDCVVVASPAREDVVGVTSAATITTNIKNSAAEYTKSSYLILDGNFLKVYDKYNDQFIQIAAAGSTAGLMAATDRDRAAWFSPAGARRGRYLGITAIDYTPTKAQRDTLYKAGVNPIANIPGAGVVLFGDKTNLGRPSAFDRINVRRLFLVLERAISRAAEQVLFEFNDEFTRAEFTNIIEPVLREVKGRRGITDFRVVCDETNNTAEVIDRNEFIANIFIKPARSINFVTLNFVAVRTGVDFEEVVGTV